MELLIRLIVWLLFAVLALFVGVESDMTGQPPPPDNGGDTNRVPILIDNVDVFLMESFPVQVSIEVTGTIQDGCDFPVITEVTPSDETTITVAVYREMPMDVMCPMNIQPYQEMIPLGSFEGGRYTVDVNGTLVTFEV